LETRAVPQTGAVLTGSTRPSPAELCRSNLQELWPESQCCAQALLRVPHLSPCEAPAGLHPDSQSEMQLLLLKAGSDCAS